VTDDAYTMALRLCDDDGMVTGEYRATHARLRALGGHDPYDGPDYACTGHAHLAGEHIRCASEFHAKPVLFPAGMSNRRDGIACVTIAREMREHFADDPNFPADVLADLDTVERVGCTLYFSTVITLPVTLTATVAVSAGV